MRFPSATKSAATLLLLVMCAGCGTSTAAGPLHYLIVQGQPFLTYGSVPVVPGQSADFTTYVVSSARDPVTLLSASIVPVPGFPVATLRHVAVNTTLHEIGAGTNWPPIVAVRPFARATLPHGQSDITFAISGQRVGVNYATAGIRIIYRYHGQDYSFIAWSAVEACVTTAKKVNSPKAGCGHAADNRLDNAVAKMAG